MGIFPKIQRCFRSKTGSIIDHFILSENFPFTFSRTDVFDSFSDHMAIKFNIFVTSKPNDNIKTIKLSNKTNMIEMNKFIETKINNINLIYNDNIENHRIDDTIDILNAIFKEAIDRFVPEININTNFIKLSTQTNKIKFEFKKTYKKIKKYGLKTNTVVFGDLFNKKISINY